MRVAVADRAGNDGSGGGSCGKLLGVQRESRLWFVGQICPVWESAGGWFSCWRLKKSTSRDVDVDLFREELAAIDAAVYLQMGSQRRAMLRLDDWRVGGPQPVSRDVECDSVLAVEPARFQFSQCAPEGVAYYATGSCVLYRLWACGQLACVVELRYSVLVLLGCCE
ncbi:hypothetical protein Taro_056187, partial [Colocasia esculenta]|nr:hypothetical protein [Colocasia esculenta]